jgi:hypothetical protein
MTYRNGARQKLISWRAWELVRTAEAVAAPVRCGGITETTAPQATGLYGSVYGVWRGIREEETMQLDVEQVRGDSGWRSDIIADELLNFLASFERAAH